jgi:hypothetical protein
MTIEKGKAWGTVGPPPPLSRWARSDVEAARLIAGEVLGGHAAAPIWLTRGDLARTIGSLNVKPDDDRDEVTLLPCDALVVTLADGVRTLAVAHVVNGRGGWRRWWRGPVTACMNAQYLGDWDVTPRSHPGDGAFELVELAASMSLRQRRTAAQRAVTGTHLPHPSLSVVKRQRHDVDLAGKGGDWWIDSVITSAVAVSVELVSEAFTVGV